MQEEVDRYFRGSFLLKGGSILSFSSQLNPGSIVKDELSKLGCCTRVQES